MTKKVSLNRHLSPTPNQQNQTCPQRLKGQFALPMFMSESAPELRQNTVKGAIELC